MEQIKRSQAQSELLSKIYSISVIVIATLIVTYFHYGIPVHHTVIHISHYYAFYIIVIYAAYRFGVKGGLIVSVVLTIIYSPSSYLQLIRLNFPHHALPAMVEVTMVYAVGLLAVFLSGKLKKEKQKVEKVSEEMLKLERQMAHDDRLRVLGQLSAGIAHEIRNPLAALKSGISIIKSGKGNDQVMDILSSEIDQLDKFIDRFLQYAKFGSAIKSDINLSHFLMELTELIKLAASRQNVQIKLATDVPDNVCIKGDKNAIKQALLNMAINGMEACKDADEPMVEISVDITDTHIIFKIEDNGTGVDEELMDKIFEPFFTTKSDGTGLGLALASKIAEEHGGILQVENLRPGSRFMLQVTRGCE